MMMKLVRTFDHCAEYKLEENSIEMKNLKKLVILHSNDLHGDFLAEKVDEKLVGGVSRLSGYVNKVRNEEKNVIYTISGDMFRGSLIDSEFQGLSTIQIMNMLAPDVVTVGNHEVDYGVAHLLFVEKCAAFPIINANIHLKYTGARLFNSHYIKEIDGMRILFIGVLTEEVLNSTRSQGLVGTLIEIEDTLQEIGRIIDAYRDIDVDFTVLLTHIGFEEDKKLAEKLDPKWGVDAIIGGHSHTLLTEPCEVNGIPIVQAAVGTDQIGRFDILVDADTNRVESYTWQCIPITEETCPRDEALEKLIVDYKAYTDDKYGQVLTRFPRTYSHPRRNSETELGSLLADGFREMLGADVALIGSGSIREPDLGPIVTLGSFRKVFPYDGAVTGFWLTGGQLRHVLQFMLRDDAFDSSKHTQWYQLSRGIFCEYDRPSHTIVSLKLNGKELQDADLITVALESYHCSNLKEKLDLDPEEVRRNGRPREIAGSSHAVLEEYFLSHPLVEADGEPRLVIHG